MKVAFIGLGTMGLPMAANLVKAGHQVRVWNRSKPAVDKLAALGAEPADTPAAAVADCETLICMLADDDATRAVLEGGGALAALPAGAVHVNMGTVSAAFAEEMTASHAARGVTYLAAPVLGRANVAEAGKLNVLVAGDAAAIERVQPLLDAMGQKTWHFGDRPAQANVVKLAANFMLAVAIEGMGEAAALVAGHGVSAAVFLDLLTSTFFASPALQGYGKALAEQRFEPPGFKLALGYKDVRLGLEAAAAAHVPMPFASVLRDNLLDALAHDEGDLDWAVLGRGAARRANQT